MQSSTVDGVDMESKLSPIEARVQSIYPSILLPIISADLLTMYNELILRQKMYDDDQNFLKIQISKYS
jgi:hypothetical protein